MSIHKLTAGSGYDYLTRQVAAQDATEKGHTSLASYYSAKGEAPGTWIGSGMAGIDVEYVDERVLDLKANRGDEAQQPDDAADQARAKLESLIRRYDNADEPYRSVVLTMWSNRYGSYDDLARIKEWSSAGGGSE